MLFPFLFITLCLGWSLAPADQFVIPMTVTFGAYDWADHLHSDDGTLHTSAC
jgi:hypothetical protein